MRGTWRGHLESRCFERSSRDRVGRANVVPFRPCEHGFDARKGVTVRPYGEYVLDGTIRVLTTIKNEDMYTEQSSSESRCEDLVLDARLETVTIHTK